MIYRNSLTWKIFGLSLLAAVVVVVLSNLAFRLTAENELVKGIGKEAVDIALEAAEAVQAGRDDYRNLLQGTIPPKEIAQKIKEPLRRLQLSLGPKGVENVYTLVLNDGRIWVAGDPDPNADPPLSQRDTANTQLKMQVFTQGAPLATAEAYTDEYGTWISGYAPIRDSDGQILAILGVDLPMVPFPLVGAIIKRNIELCLVPAILIAILLSSFLSRRITSPLQRLTDALTKVGSGSYETRLEIASHDELGRMSIAFNRMVDGLSDKERMHKLFQQAVSPEIAQALLSGAVSSEGQLIEASVLFADIRGFTALSEKLPARDVIAMINEFLSVLVPVITKHGGVIDKFVGDEIFALFGTPAPLGNDSLAAVQAACEMQQALAGLNEKRIQQGKSILEIGIGINTGALIAGVVGTNERYNYTVLGSTVNIGARLCSHAKAGEILINQSSYLRLSGVVNVLDLDPLSIKGLQFPLNVFKVLGMKGEAA